VRRLYDKAKQLGTWNPADIDLSEDARQWRGLRDDERAFVGRVVALFSGGEEAVTRDLMPLALVVARERRLDDELFVTAWLWEEGKHADFFARYLAEIVGPAPEGRRPGARLFDVELSGAMNALLTDSSSTARARALSTYCLLVEGVLADTGQGALDEALEARGLLPGLRAGLVLVNRDESRHVAYGLHFLRRLIAAEPAMLGVVTDRVRELTPSSGCAACSNAWRRSTTRPARRARPTTASRARRRRRHGRSRVERAGSRSRSAPAGAQARASTPPGARTRGP
jgi:ribonucleoside-diphosphate reductase beta chain